jgi:uroporphyrinogen decarboxylase
VPVALWRHFPVDDQNPGQLAESTLAFQREYDLDLIKVTPASSFCLKDWGVQDRWTGNPEGTREYTHWVIRHPEDWEKISLLDPHAGFLGKQLDCLKTIIGEARKTTPVIQTIFNPLAQAKNLCGAHILLDHVRNHPEKIRKGLEIITQTTIRFVEACMDYGVDGIFLAVQHAASSILSRDEYQRWGFHDDLAILYAAREAWLNILHLHGKNVYFDLAKQYPAHIVNWHDRETDPNLSQGHKETGKAVCGGWRQWETMVLGDDQKVEEEAMDAVAQLQGQHLVLGTGCVTPITASRTCLKAASRRREI